MERRLFERKGSKTVRVAQEGEERHVKQYAFAVVV